MAGDEVESFPDLEPPKSPTQEQASANHDSPGSPSRNRDSTTSSRIRSASLRFLESSPPSGMWHATGSVLAQAPTPLEIRRGSFGHSGWDEEGQRRNSTVSEESIRRLSRTPSGQTPGGMGRSPTIQMPAHTETEEEAEAVPETRKESKRPATTEDDDEDPFSKFLGRGRIDDQSYAPKARTTAEKEQLALKRRSADPYAIPDDDEDEHEFDATVKPKGLPKKFLDPAGEKISKPSEKDTTITSGTARPSSSSSADNKYQGPDENGVYPTGYKFPPKHTWGEATLIGLKGFWRFTITPLGFLIVIYGLNVVAWGGMLFLLLIGGGKEFMCYPPGSHGQKDCNNLQSPRRIWIEIDSQILNALFCVTGFGLIPWRFRDLYYLLQFRIRGRVDALRRLGGIHRSWFRLPGSHNLAPVYIEELPNPESNPAVPLPINKTPSPPLTGIRAPETKLWKLDYVIWAYVLNTFLQAVLSGFMWGLNRYNRPSWSTGTFVALACIVAGLGGLMAFQEGKRIKAVEGIPVKEEEVFRDLEKAVVEKKTKKQEKRKGKGTVDEEESVAPEIKS